MLAGLDLAAKSSGSSGVAILENFRIMTETLHSDQEILKSLSEVKMVAIDAPLSLPARGDFRKCDLEIRKLAGTLPISGAMKLLAERGISLKEELEKIGVKVIETFPRAVEKLMPEGYEYYGWNCNPKNEHEKDAALAAITAWFYCYKLHKDWEGIVTPSKKIIRMMKIQRKLSHWVKVQPLREAKKIAAVDVGYDGDTAVACAVCGGEVSIVKQKVRFPYVPSLFAFRELKLIIKALPGIDFDLVFVNGHGIAHPRDLGLASHLGIELKKPAIGICKQLLVGEVKEDKIYWNRNQVGIKYNKYYLTIGHLVDLADLEHYAEKGLELLHKAHQLSKT